MIIDKEQLLEVVAKTYSVTPDQIKGKGSIRAINEARKMICLILNGESRAVIGKLINRSQWTVRHHQLQMLDLIEYDSDIQSKYDHILSQTKADMKLNLNISQLQSVQGVLEHHLERKPMDPSTELINLHLLDISERIRKRILNNKKNLNLDEKQIKAFVIWHLHYSSGYRRIDHAYMTLQDMINQIKPDYGKSITYHQG